jgi:tetratricopeptide (TPR) repeat protein
MSPIVPSSCSPVMQLRNRPFVFVRSARVGLGRPLLALVALLAASTPARSEDVVVLADGSRVGGSIMSLGPDVIELESRSGIRKVSIVEVRELLFDGEPDSLTSARAVLRRDPQGALAELAKIEAAEIQAADPRIREEYEFLKAAAAARAATKADGEAAAQALATFLTRNARSHHFFAGQEILGDLYAQLGKFAQAAAAYGELDRGPPALRVRSATRKARLLLLQGKPADALKEFELATSIPTEDRDASSATQKGEARLGIATCLARNGKAADGIKAAREAIRSADPGDRQLLAAAFATLGECQRVVGGQDEDAVISFLTVELVYNTVPERHAEALFNLVELWEATKQPERARDARKTLTTTYPDSPWTKKLEATAKPS